MLRFLLIFILIILMLNLFGRIAFRWFIKRQLKKFEKRANGYSQGNAGDVYIKKNEKTKKNIPDNIGEYVEFEEMS